MHYRWIRTIMVIGATLAAVGLSGCRPEVRDDQPETGTMPLLAPSGPDKAVEKK